MQTAPGASERVLDPMMHALATVDFELFAFGEASPAVGRGFIFFTSISGFLVPSFSGL
jgi:hypothetical protein